MSSFRNFTGKRLLLTGSAAKYSLSRVLSGAVVGAFATLLCGAQSAEAQGKGYVAGVDYLINLNDGWMSKQLYTKSWDITCSGGVVTEAYVNIAGIRVHPDLQPINGTDNELSLHFKRATNLFEFYLITPQFPDPNHPAIYDIAQNVAYNGTQVGFSDLLPSSQTPNHPGGSYSGVIDLRCYQCSDNIDNDGDGKIDSADSGCLTNGVYNPSLNTEAGGSLPQCSDNSDNDQDGVTDKDDPGCWTNINDPKSYDPSRTNEGAATTQCQDAKDNDTDGTTDAFDPACQGPNGSWNKTRNSEVGQCQDGVDNDQDALVDKEDPGCWVSKNDPTTYSPSRNDEGAATSACQDGLDNDGDGVKDASDPACQFPNGSWNKARNSEVGQCQDGSDNDLDALVDKDDPGCWTSKSDPTTYSPSRNDEGAATSACQDGQDNDGDGVADDKDPGCQNASGVYDKKRNSETGECQNGRDDDGDNLVDDKDPGCWKDRNNPGSYDKTLNNERAATSQCQDGKDNDGDGLTDLKDPGCANPGDDNEGDEAAKLQVSTECVQDNQDATFTAYLSYENLTGAELTVTNDASGVTVNSMAPAPVDRGQPTKFAVGKNRGKVVFTFDGKPVVWSVRASGGALASTTVSSASPACKPLVPRAECVDSDAQGFKATMGYSNPDDFERSIPVGAVNGMSPAPVDRGQPTTFLAGNRAGAFVVRFTGPFSWNLTGAKADITSSVPVCPGGCTEVGTAQVKSELDATAVALSTVAKKAADFLAARTKRSLPAAVARKFAVDAQRSKKAADAYVAQVQKLGLDYPAVAKVCPSPLPFCQSVNRGATIEALKVIYGKMLDLTKRSISRAYFNTTGKTNRNDRLIKQATALRQAGLDQLAKLPVVITECK
jgi:hypothetical protein